MNSFNLKTPTDVYFGQGKISHLPEAIAENGSRVLFLYGGGSIKSIGLYKEVIDLLEQNNIFYIEKSGVKSNPRITTVREGVDLCREHDLDFILAVGGGSVIDCGKIIAAGVKYDKDPWDFLSYEATIEEALPVGVVLTLSATGSEMNGNAVITNDETTQKHGLHSPYLFPCFCVLDPSYTFSVNKHQTACGVVDTLSHCYEFYFSVNENNFVSDSMLEGVMKSALHYGMQAYNNPTDYEARANITWASSMALNGFASSGKAFDGAIHTIEHAISAVYDITHADGLSILAPNFFELALNEERLPRLARFGRNVWDINGDNDEAVARETLVQMRYFYKSLNMPTTLADVDIDDSQFDAIIEKSLMGNDSLGNFFPVTSEDIRTILTNSL